MLLLLYFKLNIARKKYLKLYLLILVLKSMCLNFIVRKKVKSRLKTGWAEKVGVNEIASGSARFEERTLLEEARKVLRESRCCLMYSCVYSYNLTDKTLKSFFKVNAYYLQSFVEKLSDFFGERRPKVVLQWEKEWDHKNHWILRGKSQNHR